MAGEDSKNMSAGLVELESTEGKEDGAEDKLSSMAGEEAMNMPAGWVYCTGTNEDGTALKFYMNVRSGTRVGSVEAMVRFVNDNSGENDVEKILTGGAEPVGKRFCSRCKEVGHSIFRCPLQPQVSIEKPLGVRARGTSSSQRRRSGCTSVDRKRKPRRCSNCGNTGHTCRDCDEEPANSPDFSVWA